MMKQLREEELKRKQEEKARKTELREAKRLEKQAKCLEKQAKRPRQRKQQRDAVGDEAENVSTESLPLSSGEQTSKDTADDKNSSEGNAGRGTTKRKSSSQIESVTKRSRNNTDVEIDVDYALVSTLMTWVQGGSG